MTTILVSSSFRGSFGAVRACSIVVAYIMTKSLPISLRWRVIMSRQRGLSVNQISETLFVSKTFVKKVIRLYENTGAVSDPPRRKSTKRLDRCWIETVSDNGEYQHLPQSYFTVGNKNMQIQHETESKPMILHFATRQNEWIFSFLMFTCENGNSY